jgi:suppressor of fused-like protein
MGLFQGKRGSKDEAAGGVSAGWNAIGAAFTRLYGVQEPRHWLLDPALGLLGPKTEGLDAYNAGAYWHFVTLGLTELWDKVEDDPSVSGVGYEYTMRVLPEPDGEPPEWAARLLAKLGDAALSGELFLPGHTLDPGGPITGDTPSRLEGIGFVSDPELPALTTPNGSVSFVQVVTMTADELTEVVNGSATLESLSGRDGLYITDPSR